MRDEDGVPHVFPELTPAPARIPEPPPIPGREPEKMHATRHTSGKVPMSFLYDFPTALEGVCRIMQQGCGEYGRDNWKLGQPDENYLNSNLRHMFKWANGENIDPKSGENHLHHAICNLLMMAEGYWSDGEK
jgi:hypothetical protein